MHALYFKDGTKLCDHYLRKVSSKRGTYYELTRDQIIPDLKCHFPNQIVDGWVEPQWYYLWLEPKDRTEKIYYQLRTVKYADYKIGLYYINIDDLLPYIENKRLFM